MYVLAAIIKKELNIPRSLADMLQILSVNTFEKTPLIQLFPPEKLQTSAPPPPNQLQLFNL